MLQVDYMDAYKVLSHPSKRIEYDTRLKMYRRGTMSTKEQSNVNRTRQGAFLKLDREKETTEKKMSAGEKADEMIKDFYAESTHTPTMLKDKLELQENITHSQKMPVIIVQRCYIVIIIIIIRIHARKVKVTRRH